MQIDKQKKLYELAPMLSPSIYETEFNKQYKARSDNNAQILDKDIFESNYISESIYKIFINSNKKRLGKAINYIGLSQLYQSTINSIDVSDKAYTLEIEDKATTMLANIIISKKTPDIKLSKKFMLKVKFENVSCFSVNKIDNKEELIKQGEIINNTNYIRDQLIYIDDKNIELVISTEDHNSGEVRYIILVCENIIVEDTAKETWKETFTSEYSMLYDYFLNVKKLCHIDYEEWFYLDVIEGFQKFLDDFLS